MNPKAPPGADAAPPARPPEPVPGRGELILVVDAEPLVGALIAAILRRDGFHALTAHNGVDALRLFQEHRAELRLVLTDLYLPQLDGPTMIHALHRLDPALPVVVVSSYPVAERLNGHYPAIRGVLPKPFQPGELVATVLRALGRSGV